ncbi:unnamed protein product, partial [Polarella glacialis]
AMSDRKGLKEEPLPDGLPEGWKCFLVLPKKGRGKKLEEKCFRFESPSGEAFEQLEDCLKQIEEEEEQRRQLTELDAMVKPSRNLSLSTVQGWKGWTVESLGGKKHRYTDPTGKVFSTLRDIEACSGKDLLAT